MKALWIWKRNLYRVHQLLILGTIIPTGTVIPVVVIVTITMGEMEEMEEMEEMVEMVEVVEMGEINVTGEMIEVVATPGAMKTEMTHQGIRTGTIVVHIHTITVVATTPKPLFLSQFFGIFISGNLKDDTDMLPHYFWKKYEFDDVNTVCISSYYSSWLLKVP